MKLVLPLLLILLLIAACTTQETQDTPQAPEQPAEDMPDTADNQNDQPADIPPMPPETQPETPDNTQPAQTHTIEITSSGFEPRELTINEGDTVTWVNNDGPGRWPASNQHPTHTQYPGVEYNEGGSFMGSRGCMGEGESKEGAFDACQELEPGEEWSFTFTETGTWRYHDHRDSTKGGTIEVQ